MRKGSTGFLESLLGAVSVSGSEAPVQRVWLDYAGQFADRTETDSYGNCYAYLNGGGSPRIMISGHADEIGFLVQYISDDGFIHFAAAGGVDRALIPGRRMIVQTRKGPVTGVTGALAIHMQDKEKERPPQKVHENFLDIGAASKAEAEKRVQIGDVITYADGFTRLAGDVVAARGCDNRIGIWAAAETLRLLKNQKKIDACVVAVSTVQEEIGHNGAFMAGHNVKPDISLVADVGHATDIPQADRRRFGAVKLGSGPMVGRGSANHPAIVERLIDVAGKSKIPLQLTTDPVRTGTDADAIFRQNGGIPTASVSLPNRYMHSPAEVINLGDLEHLAELLAAFCRSVKKGERFRVKV